MGINKLRSIECFKGVFSKLNRKFQTNVVEVKIEDSKRVSDEDTVHAQHGPIRGCRVRLAGFIGPAGFGVLGVFGVLRFALLARREPSRFRGSQGSPCWLD